MIWRYTTNSEFVSGKQLDLCKVGFFNYKIPSMTFVEMLHQFDIVDFLRMARTDRVILMRPPQNCFSGQSFSATKLTIRSGPAVFAQLGMTLRRHHKKLPSLSDSMRFRASFGASPEIPHEIWNNTFCGVWCFWRCVLLGVYPLYHCWR
jgi:hypothetical protein